MNRQIPILLSGIPLFVSQPYIVPFLQIHNAMFQYFLINHEVSYRFFNIQRDSGRATARVSV
jgi:hypothetical protein